MKKRNTIIAASYLMLLKESKILLMRRYNTGYEDGNYSLIAGHVEQDESFTKSIIREANEEAGIILKPECLRVIHVMNRRAEEPEKFDRVDVFFIAKNWSGEIVNKEPDKCDDLSWFDFDNLPKNVISCVKQAINCFKKSEFYSEYGFR